jgi:hypothetical protein
MVFKGRVPFGKGGTISPPPFTVESSHLPTDRCLSQQGKVGDRGEGGIAVPLTLTPAGATIAVALPVPPFAPFLLNVLHCRKVKASAAAASRVVEK